MCVTGETMTTEMARELVVRNAANNTWHAHRHNDTTRQPTHRRQKRKLSKNRLKPDY